MTSSRFRILAPFLASVLVLTLSFLGTWLYFLSRTQGLAGFLRDGLTDPNAIAFGRALLLREVLPLYLGGGILIWLLTLAVSLLVGRRLLDSWGFLSAFFLTFAAFGWIHLVLWWKVPTALWVVPVFQHIPFYLSFPLLCLINLVPLGYWASRALGRRAWIMIPAWLLLWTALAQAPFVLGDRVPRHPKGARPVQALLLGVDGLRPEDATTQGLEAWFGTTYPNAYTMVPATRLFYSLLWGGDPAHYSMGHVIPSEEELRGNLPYSLLESMKANGKIARFFIDDGGTIGLTNRSEQLFDEVGMPSAGWENFINSNLAVHFPFYASWLDALRVFPSTNPWSSVDAGLRTTLERGRGADLVIFHTCHLHQPIFLVRAELNDLPHWWTLRPLDLRPVAGLSLVQPKDEANTDVRMDPLGIYRIRVKHLLAAWRPLWEGLSSDPDYHQASRVLYADHGERFYHATPTLRLQGTHGFDLDPWELRVPFLVAGPGFSAGSGSDRAVSMLDLRDALVDKLLLQKEINPDSFGRHPFAPVRYHTLQTGFLRADPEGVNYLSLDPQAIIKGSKLLSGGAWVMRYQATLDERNRGVSLAKARQDRLDIFKPLKEGGAHHLVYEGFSLKETLLLDEAAFGKVKQEIEAEFFRSLPGTPPSPKPIGQKPKSP